MITSVVLEWFDCSCHCADDLSRSKIAIYRNGRRIVYEEYDGWDNVLRRQEGVFSKNSGSSFFSLLEEKNAKMTRKLDYRVEVCDGSCWSLKIRRSTHKVQTIQGTVKLPPCGRQIERAMRGLCNEAGVVSPILFV